MSITRSILTIGTLTSLGACFSAPKVDEVVEEASTGIDLGGSDGEPYVPITAGSSDDESSGESSPNDSGDDEPTVDGSSDGGSIGSSDGSSDGGTGTGSDWDDGEVPPGFPGAEPFGDDVQELDLVGTWTLPWDPSGVADIELAIADDGGFVWHERAADCSDAGLASGRMWVAGTQLVMHFDAWEKRAPWDAEAEIATAIDPPYRMRLGYSPMGGYLGISGPTELTAIQDWSGRGYVRLGPGAGAMGSWAAEAELWAVPAGEAGPLLIARDRFDAQLGSNSSALLVHARTWWWPNQLERPDDSDVGPWSDDTPGNVAGAATVIGVGHAYDATGLLTFQATGSFKLGVHSDCP